MDAEQPKRGRWEGVGAAARRLNFDLADWERRLALARTQDDFTAMLLELPKDPTRPWESEQTDGRASTSTAPATTSTLSTSTTPTVKMQTDKNRPADRNLDQLVRP